MAIKMENYKELSCDKLLYFLVHWFVCKGKEREVLAAFF